jgi:transcriptional regulator with XRE-family HTH domain
VFEKHDQITNRLGAILRGLREEKGLTREWMAEHAQIGLRHLAAIELGEKNPSVDTLYRLIRCIGVSSERIFYPERTEKGSDLEQITLLAATCTPKQRQLITAFIEMLLSRKDLNI